MAESTTTDVDVTKKAEENSTQEPINIYQAAQKYADREWFVFPCGSDKSPYTPDGFKNASRDAYNIKRWWTRHPEAAIGCACGASGLVVIDLDQKNGKNGIARFASICKDRGIDVSGALRAVTPTGGQHYIFQYDHSTDPIRGKTDLLDKGVDVKGEEGYIILPPSRVGTGVYVEDGGDWSQAPAPLPESLLELIKEKLEEVRSDAKRKAKEALSKEINTVASTPEGNRNSRLNSSAYYLGRFVYQESLSQEEVEEELVKAAQESGLELEEAIKTVRSGLAAAIEAADRGDLPGVSKKQPLTDLGNAKLLVTTYSDRIRYCPTWKKWLRYDGKRWEPCNDEHTMHLAKQVVISIGEKARSVSSTALTNWANTSQSRARLEAMVSLSKSEREVLVDTNDFDTDNYLLNCQNGLLDLRTGDLIPHSADQMLLKVAGTTYEPGAQCPQWLEFLKKVMNGDAETILFLQKAVGYSLCGDISEQCLFFLYGDGGNGKSTFLTAISRVLGDYSLKTVAKTFYDRRSSGGANNDIARLFGARLVTSSEMTDYRLDEGLIKDITGGDKITARYLYREYFEFHPKLKLWMYGNEKPDFRGTDYGIWRRLKMVPFTVRISEEEKDPQLLEKLTDELPGILNWALEGFREWKANGLGESKAVLSATQDHRAESDTLQTFIDERCVCRDDLECSSSDLYNAYKEWAESTGTRQLSQQRFSAALENKGFKKGRESGTRRSLRLGISLESQYIPPLDEISPAVLSTLGMKPEDLCS
jgi:putative DNA primase/helicase